MDSDSSDRPARRTALIAAELHRYNIDIAALSETRFADEGSLTEVGGGYTFFWKGLPADSPRIHGVGLAIRTSLLQQLPETPVAIDERLMTLRIPLAKGRYMTLLSVYAPTLTSDESSKDRFYDNLRSALRSVPPQDKVALLGDFNARVGTNHHIWNGVIGKHGVGNVNSNGLRLLNLCSEFDLIITNTLFQQRNQLKTTWMHPRSKHWHLLDYVIVRRSDRRDVHLTRAMRGAECWTDHRLVRASIQLNIRPPVRKRQPKKRLDVRACKDPLKEDLLRENIYAKLQSLPDTDPLVQRDTEALTAEWTDLSKCFMDAATASLGFSTKKHQDWFDSNNASIMQLLSEKMPLMLPSFKIRHLLHCTKSGKNFVHVRRESSARLKTTGGLTKPVKFNSTQTQTRHRSSTTQLRQHMAPGITPFTPSEPKMVLP